MGKKTLLITGSAGFIGRHLIRSLQDSKTYQILEFDLTDGDVATHRFETDRIDHVIHLAGKTYVPDSWTDPYAFYRTNFLGTVNILNLCRRHHASLTYISAYVYGVPDYLPVDEKHPLKAANPYMHSKIEAESACRFYSENFEIPVTVIRPFNIYGPGQNEHFLIPKIINQVCSDSDVIRVFSLGPKRDYIYIDDLIDALVKSVNINTRYQVINIGSGTSYSVRDIIDRCQNIAGTNKTVLEEHIDRKNEIPDVRADVQKAMELLGWSPATDIETGLAKIINYADV
ncbi:MAG: GDP-mannose 4,6-dehydratase [Bacteroidales bacterium]|nr:GDP-mannose 4,6-dehydratase [Bacteroidales bacterium]MBN2698018.1 GDP-mannose 4,6-dehydratase [Bacteroidales bacterium]